MGQLIIVAFSYSFYGQSTEECARSSSKRATHQKPGNTLAPRSILCAFLKIITGTVQSIGTPVQSSVMDKSTQLSNSESNESTQPNDSQCTNWHCECCCCFCLCHPDWFSDFWKSFCDSLWLFVRLVHTFTAAEAAVVALVVLVNIVIYRMLLPGADTIPKGVDACLVTACLVTAASAFFLFFFLPPCLFDLIPAIARFVKDSWVDDEFPRFFVAIKYIWPGSKIDKDSEFLVSTLEKKYGELTRLEACVLLQLKRVKALKNRLRMTRIVLKHVKANRLMPAIRQPGCVLPEATWVETLKNRTRLALTNRIRACAFLRLHHVKDRSRNIGSVHVARVEISVSAAQE